MIHENTGAAMTYGLDRADDIPITVLFYNIGGIDTEVSLVRYSSIYDEINNKSYEHIEILEEAWDSSLGSTDFDLVLVNLLAEKYNNLTERIGK